MKDTIRIIQFQAIQDELHKIKLKLIIDDAQYTSSIEQKFIQNWRERIGDKMELELEYVAEISVEASGKFRIVKNNIKHLIENKP